MPECARCGDFTDNPARKQYHYCDNCNRHFDVIRENGVIVESLESGGKFNHDVTVTVAGYEDRGGREKSQIEGLARGKKIAEEIGVSAMFEYPWTGSQWDLEQYLNAHPRIRAGVYDRLGRVPNRSIAGLFARLRRWLF